MQNHGRKRTRRRFLGVLGVAGAGVVIGTQAPLYVRRAAESILTSPRLTTVIGDILPLEEIVDIQEEVGLAAARELLASHTRYGAIRGEICRYIVPSARYPQYWYWDSMLAAIAAAYVAPELAKDLLETQGAIFRHLGAHGPQIVYFYTSPTSLEYRLFTQTRAIGGVDRLTQTPLSAFALEAYATLTGDRETVARLLPDYTAHYAWLMEHRTVDEAVGLPVIISPFESLDAQPAVDLMYRRNLSNNTQFQTLAVRTLVHARRHGFDARRIARDGGYVMYDTWFLAFYIRSLYALGLLWAPLDGDQSAYWTAQADVALERLLATCFDAESGFFFGRRANGAKEWLKTRTAAGLAPLLMPLPPEVVDALVATLTNPAHFLADDLYLPFVARSEPTYQTSHEPLWRGPGNSVVDFVVTLGLYVNGQEEMADRLYAAQYRRFLDRLHQGHPFPEFYSPTRAFRAPYTWGTLAVCPPRPLALGRTWVG